MSDIEALRASYKEATGKSPFNGWDAAELQKRIAEHNNPSTDTSSDPTAKAKEKAPTNSDPYPSQADLDAMRERSVAGGQKRRDMKSSAKSVDYETR